MFWPIFSVTRISALDETDKPTDQNLSYLHCRIGLEYYMGQPVPDWRYDQLQTDRQDLELTPNKSLRR